MLCYVKCCLILLLMIEDVMSCLCELCFDVGKLVIWIVRIVFFSKELIEKETFLGWVC
jgi:hypothetical protein